MEKNAAKFKVVPPRTRRGGTDNFGPIEKTEEPSFNNNLQSMRKETINTKVKAATDSKQARANRLGLHSGTQTNNTQRKQ